MHPNDQSAPPGSDGGDAGLRRLRVLILTQWFQPEPAFKGLPFAKELQRLGHDVEVVTGFPNYPGGKIYPGYRIRLWTKEIMDDVPVLRVALYPSHDSSALGRILNYVSFAVTATFGLLSRRRPDIVYVYHPPGTAALPAVMLSMLRRVPFVVDVQDLWPDTLAATGMMNKPGILRLIGAWMNFVHRRAAAIVVLSPGFKERITGRGVPEHKVHVIPNWAPEEGEDGAPPLVSRKPTSRFTVVFAGTMGLAQGLDTVIDAALLLRERAPNVQITMVGGGLEVDRLRSRVETLGADNVRFMPRRPPSEMSELFATADALLVHLRDDPLFAITIPSKTQAYLRAGKPLLIGVKGDAAALVEEAGAGMAFEPENASSLAAAVMRLASLPEQDRANMGAAGRRFYDERLSRKVGVAAFNRLFGQLAR
jgi:glycosyltransferase involved in cell wall biosynthesis